MSVLIKQSSVSFYSNYIAKAIPQKVVRIRGQMKINTAEKIAAKYPHFDKAIMRHYANTKGGDAVIIKSVTIYE